MWAGVAWLFIMFLYQYNFVYYQKAVKEDDKMYKAAYQKMRHSVRRIVLALLMFCGMTLTLICTIEQEFFICAGKGILCALVIIPLLNSYYGNEKRFKFSEEYLF